jgi:hypothetical protein
MLPWNPHRCPLQGQSFPSFVRGRIGGLPSSNLAYKLCQGPLIMCHAPDLMHKGTQHFPFPDTELNLLLFAGSAAESTPVAARWRGGRQNWVLLPSGLEAPQRKALHSFAAASGARMAATWQPGVTHVICHLDEHGCAKCATAHLLHTFLAALSKLLTKRHNVLNDAGPRSFITLS